MSVLLPQNAPISSSGNIPKASEARNEPAGTVAANSSLICPVKENIMQPQTIETDRLIIDKFVLEDDVFILELLNDEDWLRYIGDMKVRELKDARKYLQNGPITMYERVGYGLMRVELKNSRIPVGMCGLIKRTTLSHPDLGFAFLKRWRNLGYAIEAARAVLRYGWDELEIDRVVAITDPDNAKSIRLLKKLEFRFQEFLRLSSDGPEISLFVIDRIPITKQGVAM